MIGGLGSDELEGDGHDDILIAGYTLYDTSYNHSGALNQDTRRLAIEKIMAEWSSSRTLAQRQANLLGTGSGSSWTNRKNGTWYLKSNLAGSANNTVFDDFSIDEIEGDQGSDWIFANINAELGTTLDSIQDNDNTDTRRDIDRW